jgi:hypothetical protein
MLRDRLLDEINTWTTTEYLTFDVLVLSYGWSLTGLYIFYGRHWVVLNIVQFILMYLKYGFYNYITIDWIDL